MAKESDEKLQQLQVIEQNMQTLIVQRRTFQSQLMEIESALGELDKTQSAYRIIGNIMVLSDKKDLSQDLTSKKEKLDLRIKSLEKQEEKLKERAESLQKEVMASLKGD